MIGIVDTDSDKVELPLLDEEVAKLIKSGKGWSFSYVYHLVELRNIYLALRDAGPIKFEDFVKYCSTIKLPFVKTQWKKRRILEQLNALINFELVESVSGYYRIKKVVFSDSIINSEISERDLEIFRDIYFTYFRFKEIFSWFIDPLVQNRRAFIADLTKETIIEKSRPLFCLSEQGHFTDSYFSELTKAPKVYFLSKEHEDLMRFWDVFVTWGTDLNIIEKFNLRNIPIKTATGKGIACVYVIKGLPKDFDLLKYIKGKIPESYIYLPTLVLAIALEFRSRIDDVHTMIIQQYKVHKQHFSFERTSEIFIKKTKIKEDEKIFFLKYMDSYISHIIIR